MLTDGDTRLFLPKLWQQKPKLLGIAIHYLRKMSYVKTLEEYWSFDWSKIQVLGNNGDALHDGIAAYYPMFNPVIVPVLAVLGYWFLSDPVMGAIRAILNGETIKDKDGKVMKNGFDVALKWLSVVHSLALTVYSGWTFINTYNIVMSVYAHYSGNGLSLWDAYMAMQCDMDGTVWIKHDLGFWINHFYISKYWEFLDTWIIILKGKKPILLQTYHHAGVVLLMWMFTVSHNTACGYVRSPHVD